MRLTKRSDSDERFVSAHESRNRIDARDGLRFFDGKQREQHLKFLQRHRFAAAGSADRNEVVSAGCRNLQAAHKKTLPRHIDEVETFRNGRKEHAIRFDTVFRHKGALIRSAPLGKNFVRSERGKRIFERCRTCLLYTSDAADEL